MSPFPAAALFVTAYSTNPVRVLLEQCGERGEEWMWKSETERCAFVNSYSCLRPLNRMVFFWEASRPIYSIRWGLFCVHGLRLASIQPPFLGILPCMKPRCDQLLLLNNLVRGASGSASRIHLIKELDTFDTQWLPLLIDNCGEIGLMHL